MNASKQRCARRRGVDRIVAHPHVAARGTLEHVHLPGREAPLAVVGPGFATDPRPTPHVPRLGEHSDAVLAELGYDAEAIARLRATRAV